MEPIIKFREALKGGRICVGAGITFSDPLVTDTLGSSVDFIWIDLEHGGMSPEALGGHLLACRARNVPGFVRVPGGGTSIVKPVLDLGADGVIVPQVRSVEEIRQLVDDCRYPPLGHRGFGPRVPSNYTRDEGEDYVERANRNVFVAVMIETAEAMDALDDILAVPGLDSVVIGPKDLSWAIGTKGDVLHPQSMEAMRTVATKARAAGRFIGAGMGPDPEFAFKLAQLGVQWMQLGLDCAHLVKSFDTALATFYNDIKKEPAEVTG
ncbi:MAG: aldolase/citrate lyase family protein [Anaerolineales bacterium]|jgi:2-keto-3-deoxy-L-rhamnonate aldolase RhmA